jgi:pimeloyl-ACP methyl ester carboxylesterase
MHEMMAAAMTGDDAANFLEALMTGPSTRELLSQIRVPTLVIHARGDRLVPFEAGGRELAAGIPGSRLVVLETDNHGFPPNDPTFPEFVQAIDDFLAEDPELAAAK